MMIPLSHETEVLAWRLADAQGVPIDVAVRRALEEGVRRTAQRGRKDCSPAAVKARRARMQQIAAEIAALPLLDPRSADEIMDDLNAL